MKVKTCRDEYIMQVGPYVYDFVRENGKEYVVAAVSDNTAHYAVYNLESDKITLADTNMTDEEFKNHQTTLRRNLKLLVSAGREGWKREP